MKSQIISILSLVILFYACTLKSNQLEADELAKETFGSKELEGTFTTIKYVDSVIVERTNSIEINQAYHASYIEKARISNEKGEQFPSLLKDTVKYPFLERLDKEGLNAF